MSMLRADVDARKKLAEFSRGAVVVSVYPEALPCRLGTGFEFPRFSPRVLLVVHARIARQESKGLQPREGQ
jgi:hypothetical protein